MADAELPSRTLFVLTANARLKVAGGEEHDLPLNEPANQALLQQLEAAAAGGVNDIVLQEVQSAAANDLRPRGPFANPHSPLAVDVVRLPLLADLPPATVAAIRDRMQTEPAARLGLGEDVVAMTVLGKMDPAEREQLGVRPLRVVINTCSKARQLAAEYQVKRDALAARLAAAASAPAP